MNRQLVRKIDVAQVQAEHAHDLLRREWLVANGLGGYASGTISGIVSRRYHGVLVASLPAPLGRVVMLNHLSECLKMPGGRCLMFGGEDPLSINDPSVPHYVTEFRLEDGLPCWRYEVEGYVIEKRLLLVHGQNTAHVTYRLASSHDYAWLEVRPSMHFRRHEHNVDEPLQTDYVVTIQNDRYTISTAEPFHPLRLHMHATELNFTHQGDHCSEMEYQVEAERGYPSRGALWSPGFFTVQLRPDRPITLVASTESWSRILALDPEAAYASETERRHRLITAAHVHAQAGPAAELVLAADQFIISPAGRVEDTERAEAAGELARTVIAGYHWFTDWGRDTMISLEGLTLSTGRYAEAGWILRTFGHYVRDGLIPNYFPDGANDGLYHTADATLWFFHALDRYLEATADRKTLQILLPRLIEIADYHLNGTHFGIGVDPADGLLRQGADGYQLTWMDAKVGDWVVTPRRGKAVEINALWYNALCLLANWLREEHGDGTAQPFVEHAQRVRESFNQRFWSDELNHLLDVIDGEEGDDPACRPNQILAFSLRHPVLNDDRWAPVLDTVCRELFTPVGLRSLSRAHPDYKTRYFGDLRARDAAYHQGTVWGWLIGPFIDAWLKVHPEDRKGARKWLEGFISHLSLACVGSVSEVFDAEEPFTPRGCIAQAWSVAETLRCWVKTEEPDAAGK